MNSKKAIIYITPAMSSFVRSDIAVLSEKYKVLVNTYNWQHRFLTPVYLFHQFFYLLLKMASAKAVIVSFGGYWSLFPTLLSKIYKTPVYIILNGTDTASIPQINYGSLRKTWLKFIIKLSFSNATKLLPVSTSLIQTKTKYAYPDATGYNYQGFLYYFPGLGTPYEVIPNGFDFDYWNDEQLKKEPDSFIAVFSKEQFLLKGGDLIVPIALKFPTAKFYIAGCDQPKHLAFCPNNLIFLGRLSADQLRSYYCRCQFHFQLSVFEGFGCALCEAMLCGCIPIVSEVNILPEIIGGAGYVLKEKNIRLLEKLLVEAMSTADKVGIGTDARQRIIANFALSIRAKKLLDLID